MSRKSMEGEQLKANRNKAGRALIRIAGGALSLAMLAGLYFTLIIGQPQQEERHGETQQPLLTASPAMSIEKEEDLRELVAAFPAPVMSFMSGSGIRFVSGTSSDAAWHGGFGRILTLYWQNAEDEPMILQSIYPAEALELMGKGDYAFSPVSGPSLFGQRSVRMENGETVRIHVQAEGEGLYVLTVPESLGDSLSELSRSVQLFTAEP